MQRYKCGSCGKQFRKDNSLDAAIILAEYIQGKQTYHQLALQFNCSVKTIQRRIDAASVQRHTTFSSVANVLRDTTYFGRNFGVMVFKDSISGQILFKQYVKQETNQLYLSAIEEIGRRAIKVQAIICDGRKGLLQLFEGIPVQMCNFHEVAIIRRYLTKKPKLQAGKELGGTCAAFGLNR